MAGASDQIYMFLQWELVLDTKQVHDFTKYGQVECDAIHLKQLGLGKHMFCIVKPFATVPNLYLNCTLDRYVMENKTLKETNLTLWNIYFPACIYSILSTRV